jgi:perosamine synthetase
MRILVPPRPRSMLYGGAGKYASIARDLVLSADATGAAVERLETEASRWLGARYGVCVPQARIGIYLTLKALIEPGQNVILSPYTIYDVVNMVIAAGGRPVFADIERETCNISVESIKGLIDGETGAVLVTHLHGLACAIEDIRDLCLARGIPLIEDASQAFGARVAGKRVGTFGTAAVFSFGMAKNVNAFYGGLVVTDDRELAQRVRAAMASWPTQDRGALMRRVAFCLVGEVLTARPVFAGLTFWVYRYGHLHGIEAITNRWRGEDAPVLRRGIPERKLRRMSSSQARLILRALPRVDSDAATRIGYARLYHESLRDVPEILLPPLRADGSHVYLAFPIQVRDRHKLLRFLVRDGRDLTIQHIGNAAEYPCFSEYRRDCPHARATADQVLLLPTYPGYGRREVERNVTLVRHYFGASGRQADPK